jgi:excisionase family DNA binding protein
MDLNESTCCLLDRATVASVGEFVGQDEILARAGCSRQTLDRWIERGVFPAPLSDWPGRKRRWRRASVDQWFRELK